MSSARVCDRLTAIYDGDMTQTTSDRNIYLILNRRFGAIRTVHAAIGRPNHTREDPKN